MRQSRRHFSAPQKAQIVRRHISGKEPVSNLADECGLQPSQIHNWIKQVLDQAEPALDAQQAVRPAQSGFKRARRAAPIQSRQEERGHRRADEGARAAKKELGEL